MDQKAIAERIKCIREDLELTVSEMCNLCGMNEKDYLSLESGNVDFTFSFLNRCADIFGITIAELLTGDDISRLHAFAVERKGCGLRVDRRKDFEYLHLASKFHNSHITPLYVKVPYDAAALDKPITTNMHDGQEFDYVLKGGLKYMIHDKIVYLNEGDSIMFDSSSPHGMVATTEAGCAFLAIVVKENNN